MILLSGKKEVWEKKESFCFCKFFKFFADSLSLVGFAVVWSLALFTLEWLLWSSGNWLSSLSMRSEHLPLLVPSLKFSYCQFEKDMQLSNFWRSCVKIFQWLLHTPRTSDEVPAAFWICFLLSSHWWFCAHAIIQGVTSRVSYHGWKLLLYLDWSLFAQNLF